MDSLDTDFEGDRGEIFMLALKTWALTILTLGIYRFWQKTRLRRYYWQVVQPGGSGFDYTGTGIEKLIGFFVAVILLAFYLSVANAIAMVITVVAFDNPATLLTGASVMVPILLMPMYFVARYRSRAYILSRTTWRGVRFAMQGGAWGYAWRGCMYLALTVLSAGLLWPLMTFRLEKYVTDRTWFGDARFTQEGSAIRLYPYLLGIFIPLLATGGIAVYFSLAYTGNPIAAAQNWGEILILSLVSLASMIAIALGFVYYRVATTRLMWTMKILGPGLEFEVWPSTRTLVRIHVLGNWFAGFVGSFVSPIVTGLVLGLLYLMGQFDPSGMVDFSGQTPGLFNLPPNLQAFITGLTIVVWLLTYQVIREAFVVFPQVRHVAQTVQVHEPELLSAIRQRGGREGARDAGGFAEALDVGAAF